MVRLGIMASGRGSNAESVLRACREGRVQAEGAVVVSNKTSARVHDVATEYGIPSFTICRDQFSSGKVFADKLISTFREHGVDVILLAGYMRKIPPALIRAFPKAILNIHPALLPKHGGKGMYGERVHENVIREGDTETGVTIHFVNEKYDDGAIFFQQGGVPVRPDDTVQTLAARVLKVEHESYPKAVQLWIDTVYTGKGQT